MNEQERKDYATQLILHHVRSIKLASIYEAWERDHDGEEINLKDDLEDARAIKKFIEEASVTVAWGHS
jgi:hypothetical protein